VVPFGLPAERAFAQPAPRHLLRIVHSRLLTGMEQLPRKRFAASVCAKA
jgi:hypothetical protein